MNAKLILGGLLVCFLLAGSLCPTDAAVAAPLANDSSGAFFTNGIVQRVRIQLEPTALASLRQDSRRYVRATVTVGDTVYTEVGLHLKGGLASFQPLDRQPCLTLKFNKFIPGQKFHDMEKLHLNSELFRKAGVPAARVTHARVQLNGRDLGFYVLVEGFDKPFLRRHFASTDGNLYDGGARADVMDALKKISGHGPDDRADLKVLASAAGGPASNRLACLQQVVDMDRFYSFLALEILMAHWDGYAMGQNNYKLYHDPASNRFVFLPHGMDQMFWEPQGTIYPRMNGLVAACYLLEPIGEAPQ
jgi:spore coat protein CotH